MNEQITTPPVKPAPKERIVLAYNHDKTWDVYVSGEFLFNSNSSEDVLGALARLMQKLD